MRVLTDTDTSGVLLKLLNEARLEADELRARLERSERILLSTRMIMGHEIKRPATAIGGYLDLAIDQAGAETRGEVIDAIQKARRECKPLDELGSFFLRLLKMDGRRNGEHGKLLDAKNCLEEVLARLPEELGAKSRVTTRVAPDAARFRADPDALNIILVNLIENALQYSDAGSPVEVTVEKSAEKRGAAAGDLLRIRVADHGGGIPEESIKAVFRPFVRLREDVSQGVGLGLTLVRSLVELQGGSVFIRSEESTGTTVHVTIPETPLTDGGAVLS
jgi:signal transduction histidine kinase